MTSREGWQELNKAIANASEALAFHIEGLLDAEEKTPFRSNSNTSPPIPNSPA